jgi:hypothetical protein
MLHPKVGGERGGLHVLQEVYSGVIFQCEENHDQQRHLHSPHRQSSQVCIIKMRRRERERTALVL